MGKERKREGKRRRGRDKGLEKGRERRRKRKASVVVVKGIAGCSFKAFTTRNSTSCFLTLISHSNTGVVTSSTTVVLQPAVKTHSFPSQLFLSTSSIQTVMVQLDPYEEFVGWNLWTGLCGRGTTGAARAELIRNWDRIGMFNHHEGYSSRACNYFID